MNKVTLVEELDDKIKSLELVLANCKRYLSDPKRKREIEKLLGL